jgi:hypothetical protein
MNPEAILAAMIPSAFKLAVEALKAILAGDIEKARRKAEEAARRQAVRIGVNAVLAAKAKAKT